MNLPVSVASTCSPQYPAFSTLLFTVLAGCAAVLRTEGSYEALMAPVAGVERNLKDIPVSAQSLRRSPQPLMPHVLHHRKAGMKREHTVEVILGKPRAARHVPDCYLRIALVLPYVADSSRDKLAVLGCVFLHFRCLLIVLLEDRSAVPVFSLIITHPQESFLTLSIFFLCAA